MVDSGHSTRGTFQHYVPAAFLGRFSASTSGRSRKRNLWALGTGTAEPYEKKAEKLAAETGLYDVDDGTLGPDATADVAWGYEGFLTPALDTLSDAQATLDAQAWLRGVVPFVAGLFVRGPEFQEEFRQRIAPALPHIGIDPASNATAGRLLDLQTLLAPIMASRFCVLHFTESVDLITSDRGYALAGTPDGREHAYIVPVGRHVALTVVPREAAEPLLWKDGAWQAEVEHRVCADTEAPELNRAMAAFAIRSVFGPSREVVESVREEIGAAPAPSGGLFPVLDPASHLYDYFRVLAATTTGPEGATAAASMLDWSLVRGQDWTAPIVVESLFPDRAEGGVSVAGNRLRVDLGYGLAQRKARKEARDPSMGALVLIDLAKLRGGTGVPGAEVAAAAAAEPESPEPKAAPGRWRRILSWLRGG
jgi:hypothetical protein